MIRNVYTVTGKDTKLLRHEKYLEIPVQDDWLGNASRYSRGSKVKRILATITAKDDAHGENDQNTLDLGQKEQETCQLMRIMHQGKESKARE